MIDCAAIRASYGFLLQGIHTGNLIKEVSSLIQGGGGQAFFAMAGGKNAAGLNQAIENLTCSRQKNIPQRHKNQYD
jgi:alanyl-tRNA synthetase